MRDNRGSDGSKVSSDCGTGELGEELFSSVLFAVGDDEEEVLVVLRGKVKESDRVCAECKFEVDGRRYFGMVGK